MRLLSYIKESVDIDIILKDCSDYIKKYNEVRLYRGINKTVWGSEKFYPRTDRKPRDTDMKVHNILDNLFYKKFHWKARSNGIFVGTSDDFVEDYGDIYKFLPCNGYKYVYSPHVKDLTAHLSTVGILDYDYKPKTDDDDYLEQQLSDVVDSYTDKNLEDAHIGGNREVSFYCPNGYYLIDDTFADKYYRELHNKRS